MAEARASRSSSRSFLAERLDHPHAVDVLVHDLGHVALALLAVPGGGEHAPAHAVGDEQQGGGHGDAHHGQQGRQVDHHAQRDQHQQHVAAHDGEEAEEPLHQGRVGVGPGDELPGRHPVEVVEVHRLEVVVHVVAQVVLHGQGDPATAVAADVGEAEARPGPGRQEHQPRPQGRVVVEDHAVDDLRVRSAARPSGTCCRARPRPATAPRPGGGGACSPTAASPIPALPPRYWRGRSRTSTSSG